MRRFFNGEVLGAILIAVSFFLLIYYVDQRIENVWETLSQEVNVRADLSEETAKVAIEVATKEDFWGERWVVCEATITEPRLWRVGGMLIPVEDLVRLTGWSAEGFAVTRDREEDINLLREEIDKQKIDIKVVTSLK